MKRNKNRISISVDDEINKRMEEDKTKNTNRSKFINSLLSNYYNKKEGVYYV